METQIGFAQKSEVAAVLIGNALSAKVSNASEHKDVGLLVDSIRTLEDELEAEYQSLEVVRVAKQLQKQKVLLGKQLEEARKTAKRAMINFEEAQELERVKLEREAQAKASQEAEQAALEAAVEAEASGDKAQAEAILDEPIAPAVVVVPKQELKAPGHTRRRIFKAKLVDAGIVPDEYWAIDQSKADAVARARKEEGLNVIPGFLVYSEVV